MGRHQDAYVAVVLDRPATKRYVEFKGVELSSADKGDVAVDTRMS